WAKKLYLHTANELERLEHEKNEALAKADELGADKTAIIEYYALRQAEILDRQAEEDREREERRLVSLADFEEGWSRKLFEQTADRLEMLEREKQEALATADELGADKLAILEYYANEEAKIRDAQEAEEERRIAKAEAQRKSWEQRLAEQMADEVERLEMRMAEELALAEELGIETAAIVAYYANEKNKILERRAEEAERVAKAEAEAEIAEEQRKYDEIGRIEADYRKKLFELTADRIDILEKEKEDQIAIAKTAGADWLLIEEYYNALIEAERERRADELAKIAEAEAEAEKAAHEKAKQARLSFEKQWQDKLTKLTAKTAEDRLKILDAEHKKVLEEAEGLGADVEAVNRYYGEKRLKLEQEIADQHLTIWEQTTKRLKTEFENAFDEIGKTVEKAMVDVGNTLLAGGSDWKAILVTALSAVINQIIVAAVAAMGIAELVSKALSQMWNPLGWIVIAGLLVALAAIRNSLASQLGSGIKGGGGTGGGTGGGGGGGSTSKPSGGRQVSEITGPSRDLLTDLLAPLAHLSQIVAPIQDIRNMLDARLPHFGDFAPAGAPAGAVGVGGVNVTIQSLSINAPTATVGDIGKLTIDEIERAIASRLAFSRRGRAGS
ncbi:MAG: hypothetical protein WAO24_05120, partial [Peptococcia bacterium]